MKSILTTNKTDPTRKIGSNCCFDVWPQRSVKFLSGRMRVEWKISQTTSDTGLVLSFVTRVQHVSTTRSYF